VAHPAPRLSGVGRNPSRALRVAYGDGLRPLPTEPGRESPEFGSYGKQTGGRISHFSDAYPGGMAIQGPVADWRMTCGWLRSRCLRHVPRSPFLASAYLGTVTGLGLGALYGLVFAIVTAFGDYAPGLGGFAVVAGCLVGTIAGLTIGTLNGIVLAVLLRTAILRAGTGVSRNRVTGVAVVTTSLGSMALLHTLLQSSGGIFVYPPAIAATLMAVPMSRKLRLL
jgi:hypothetical protein